MLSVNSLSGGRTSSYLAVHYPADIEIFALVCVRDHNARGKLYRDKKLVQKVNDKLERHIPEYGEFRATTEDPQTLRVMFDLEQHLGREIIWVRGIAWEDMMNQRKAIPNIAMRFCTYEMKILPIFRYLFQYHTLPVEMRCGYRFEEQERADDFITNMPYCNRVQLINDPEKIINPILHQALRLHPSGHSYYLQRWTSLEWRTGRFPLIEDKIGHYAVHQYWKPKSLVFPEDSNCQNCFWKDPQQLRKNFDTNFAIMQWSSIQEVVRGQTFKSDITMEQVKQLGIQQDFFFGTGSGCQAGFCTD